MPPSSLQPDPTGMRSALEAVRGLRAADDLAGVLDRLARLIAAALPCGTVVTYVRRPAWDDFEAVTVHGGAEVRRRLLGDARTWDSWAPQLHPRLERRGAHHGDELLVVLRGASGAVLGIVAVDDVPGGRLDDDAVDRLVALAEVAALALERAAELRRSARDLAALHRLRTIHTLPPDHRGAGGALDAICAGIRDVLGFERVVVLVADDEPLLGTDRRAAPRLRPLATVGLPDDDDSLHALLTVDDIARMLRPAFERRGCHLLGHEDAERLLALDAPRHRSRANGRGPEAWQRHWLLAGLHDERGRLRGVLAADEPVDRLLPDDDALDVLRLFADEATAALRDARSLEVRDPRVDEDPLTGLANRAVLAARLHHALQRTKRTPDAIALLFLDLDRFKDINDTLGHGAGDELLRVIAARIDEAVRPGDTVSRFGGDEFVVLCEDVHGAAAALEVAERLRACVAEPIALPAGAVAVTVSIGIALPDRPGRTAEEILQAADRAMYEVKAAGRDASRLATPGAGWP